jgi:hypothetical protein
MDVVRHGAGEPGVSDGDATAVVDARDLDGADDFVPSHAGWCGPAVAGLKAPSAAVLRSRCEPLCTPVTAEREPMSAPDVAHVLARRRRLRGSEGGLMTTTSAKVIEGTAWPDFLTVEQAAAIVRIGRTAAYELARRYLATDGVEGLPVLRIGKQLRVPRVALERWLGGPLTPPTRTRSSSASGRSRSRSDRALALAPVEQLALLSE